MNDFMENYPNLKEFAQREYDSIFNILNNLAIKAITPEINATKKYANDKIIELTFNIKTSKNLDTLEERNQEVNDLKQYLVTRYNALTEFINNNETSI